MRASDAPFVPAAASLPLSRPAGGRRFRGVLGLALGLVLGASPLAAQQFELGGSFPGRAAWTEGVECADVDRDGDLDLFFARGEGTASAGARRQAALVINRLETAPFTFADESVARLGVAETHARSVTTGDVTGNGWVDAVFAVAFESDPPLLYVNRGASQPGYFDSEGAARGLVEALSSTDAQLGDVDADGDLDLAVNDAGDDLLGGSGGFARLYLNDGAGVFTEASPTDFPVPAQVAPTDVQLVDVDGDWDLDYLGAALGGGHALLLNDGAGSFTDASGLLPATGTSIYEFEPADLDADTDVDVFTLALTGLQDGGLVNDLVPGGTLAFSKGATVGGGEEREVALFDYDQDRDYDAFLASSGSTEKVLENRPGGVLFLDDSAAVESVADTTLDLTVADLDNDGAYDLVTAQGESGSWEDRWYVNTSIPDVLEPTVVRQEEPERFSPFTGPWVVRAESRDQVRDDGRTWVSAVASYVIVDEPNVVEVSMAGFDFVPQHVTVPAGTTVRWSNPTGMVHTVTSSDPGTFFNSGSMFPGAQFEYTFVEPGVYDYFCIPHASLAMDGTVTVTGSVDQVPGLPIGGGLHRFELTDTADAQGSYVVYQIRFTDWAGNDSAAESRVVALGGWKTYGEDAGGANVIALDGGGSSSIGELFQLTATDVPGPVTATFVSLGETSLAALGGVLLFDPLQYVAPLLVDPAVGGVTTHDVPVPNKPGLVGVSVFFQSVAQDLSQPEDIALSNGVELVVCP